MPEVQDNYEDQEGMQAQPEYMEAGQEDPETQENIAELQNTFHDREMNVMDGNHDMADYNMPEEQEEMQPPMYAAEGMEAGADEGTYNLDMPQGAATEEEPEPALPPDEEEYEEEGGAPGGFGA
jgi:hypothetical protein